MVQDALTLTATKPSIRFLNQTTTKNLVTQPPRLLALVRPTTKHHFPSFALFAAILLFLLNNQRFNISRSHYKSRCEPPRRCVKFLPLLFSAPPRLCVKTNHANTVASEKIISNAGNDLRQIRPNFCAYIEED